MFGRVKKKPQIKAHIQIGVCGEGGGTSIVLLIPLFLPHVPESQKEMSQSDSLQPSPNK